MQSRAVLDRLQNFLGAPTPASWIDSAVSQTDLLLLDHAHCEKKAAGFALRLIHEYAEKDQLIDVMSVVVREEMLHFRQVIQIIRQRQLNYRNLRASSYAGALNRRVAPHDPQRLVDKLIVGAFIEARSCERFALLAPNLDAELGRLFRMLVKSESRHYRCYLDLAVEYARTDPRPSIDAFRDLENELITRPDPVFRFHSGPPPAIISDSRVLSG